MNLGEVSVRWFSLSAAETLNKHEGNPALQLLKRQLLGDIYTLFDNKVQISHLQLHHFCQPRQNESMQGREQFDQKNKLTLEPSIEELECLYSESQNKKNRTPYVYLHLADANLDEIRYRSTNLYYRLKALTDKGFVKIAGGVLDEAFIGPDDVSFSVASVNVYYQKVVEMFGADAVAPVVWIPERFFEARTAEIISKVYETSEFFQDRENIYIIVDQNVIEHSLPEDWQGNVFTGWVNPAFPKLKVFVSSNHLRAIMPQASPFEVNNHMFHLMNTVWSDEQRLAVNWFIEEYEKLIWMYAYVRDNFSVKGVSEASTKINSFLAEAEERLTSIEPLLVFFVDDLEKNGSWTGTQEFAFEERRHFLRYIEQSSNMFNPYHMKQLEDHQPEYKEINHINPSSYKEFSIIWNNKPEDVERWRELTLIFINNNINSVQHIKNLSDDDVQDIGILQEDIDWYVSFIRKPISWQEGQFEKYPEIKLNWELAQFFYKEITSSALSIESLSESLQDESSNLGNLLHIWNKNRASCPNFIGFFGGASILFFRLNIASQLAGIATLIYNQDNIFKTVEVNGKEWTLLKIAEDIKILNERGDAVFICNTKNLHPLVSGFSRHREGYSSIIRELASGREDIEEFALVEKEGGTASSHELVTALDLAGMQNSDLFNKTHPKKDVYDQELSTVQPYPTAWGQVWLMSSKIINSPMRSYVDLNMLPVEHISSNLYQDQYGEGTMLTFVNRVKFCGNQVDIIKKYSTNDTKVTVEIWNRSNNLISFNPIVAFPTTFDWYEGENYRIEGSPFPLDGEIRQYYKDNIYMEDKISNIGLKINTNRNDTKFSCTTMYSCQPSDDGEYTVSPQHELLMLSSLCSISLLPDQDYRIEYGVENKALGNQSTWDLDLASIPDELRSKIRTYEESVLKDRGLTSFQKIKLIYARFPEIVFWATHKV